MPAPQMAARQCWPPLPQHPASRIDRASYDPDDSRHRDQTVGRLSRLDDVNAPQNGELAIIPTWRRANMATDSPMQLGMVGLGRMGANLVRRLMRDGHRCVAYDRKPDVVKSLEAEGASGAH